MKVLQLGKHYPFYYGGIEKFMLDLSEELNNNSIRTDIFCANINNYNKIFYEGNIKVISYGRFAFKFSTSLSYKIFFLLKKYIDRYDILYVHAPDPMITIALFFIKPKQPIIVHWHSDIVKQKFLLKFYLPFQNWLLKRANKIIVTSPKYMRESFFLKKYDYKSIIIPIGIDRDKFIIDDSQVSKIRKKFGNKNIIFSLGRLVYYKGFEFLIKSANYLDDNYIILIGGDGELRKSLEELIIKNNLSSKVKLLGKIDIKDLGNYYKACNLFCLPSIEKSEAFGIVQLEAFSFGKPVVATRIKGSGVDWVNQHGVTGLNVNPRNSNELASAFVQICENRELYFKYSRNAFLRFKKKFDRKIVTRNIINLLYSVKI